MSDEDPSLRDFFISYSSADRAWAEWVYWHLQEAGYTVELDVYDWAPGDNLVARMNDALTRSRRVIALWSAAYFNARWASEEFQSVIAMEKAMGRTILLPVRISPCDLPAFAAPRIYADLVGLARREALQCLLAAAQGRQLGGRKHRLPFAGRRSPKLESRAQTRRKRIPGRPLALSAAEPGFPQSPPMWFMRGQLRNPNFTGRERLLTELREQLHANHRVLLQALKGMGGIGKTSIAIEYAYRHAADYDLVCWIPAEQPDTIDGRLLDLAQAIDISGRGGEGMRVEEVLGLLRQRKNALLIYDNAEDPAELRSYLPGGVCHVIVTSRRSGWKDVGSQLSVEVFSRLETVELIRRRCPGISELAADQLAEELGDLPLAVAQASAYMDRTGMDPQDYLERFRRRSHTLLSKYEPADYRYTLATTWALSFERLAAISPVSIFLLKSAAFMAPEPIPLDLFAKKDDSLRPAVEDAVGTLVDFSIVDRVGKDSFQVHRLVQAVTSDSLLPEEKDEYRLRARDVFSGTLGLGDPTDPASWTRYRELAPHILFTGVHERIDDELSRIRAFDVARYFAAVGRKVTAADLFGLLHGGFVEFLGADHEDTLTVAQHLARALSDLGQYASALELAEDTLSRRQRVLGETSERTLESSRLVVSLLGRTGDYNASLEHARQLLALARNAEGNDRKEAFEAANQVALMLYHLGRFEESIEVGNRYLVRARELFGEDHGLVLQIIGNLANAWREIGAYQTSKNLGEDLLARRRRVDGEKSEATLTTMHNLALTYQSLGSYGAAVALATETLEGRRKVLGEEHPETLLTAACLAAMRQGRGDLEQAKYSQRTLLLASVGCSAQAILRP